jgi:Tol biopolymer transport system component/DNA-binding winged helix-turn-helix (wHTH) protein
VALVRFADFAVDTETGGLTRDGRPVKLHPQPAELLVLLVQRQGSLVPREEIREKLWGGDTHVDFDLGINSCVRQIRTALRDDPEHPRFVQTVPRKGYRFVGPIESAEPVPKAGSGSRRIAVAVLAVVTGAGLWLFLRPSSNPVSPPIRIRPLTSFAGVESYGAISPDGDKVAYTWNGGSGRSEHLYVQLIDGSEPLQLTREDRRDYSPAWSPDGNRIAFLREIRDPGEPGMSEIRIISALGGTETRLGTAAVRVEIGHDFVSGLDWSPDGKYLVFSDKESSGEPEGIFLLSIETGEKKRLSARPSGEAPFRDRKAAFSPDGQTVAFVRGALKAKFQILLQKLEEGEARVLTTDEGQIYDLDWIPDGSAIVYARGFWEERGLTRVSVKDGRPSELTSGSGAVSVSLSGDGRQLVFTQDTGSLLNIWRAPGPASKVGESPVKLMPSSRSDFFPEYSPDGSQIAFNSLRSGWPSVWRCDSKGGSCLPIGAENSSGPRWSPDGSKIGYGINEDDKRDLYFTSLEGGFTRRLTRGRVGRWPFAWSSDGLKIYYESNETGQFEIWRRSLEGEDAVPITRSGGIAPRESLDGRYVYYAKPRSDAAYKWVDIWKVPVEGGQERPVLKDKLLEAPNWVLWEDVLLYRAWVSEYGHSFINGYHVETQEETRLVTFGPEDIPFGFGLSVSPDGKWILYSKEEPRNSDIILIENFTP